MSSLYSIDLMKELSDGFEEDGFTPEEVKSLLSRGRLREVRGVVRGTHETRPIEHTIDLSIPCMLPFAGAGRVSPAKSGVVKLQRQGDDLYLDGTKINLFVSEYQEDGKAVNGNFLRGILSSRGGNISAKVLDYLVEHPELWPESWKNDAQGNTIPVFFWDDIFRGPAGGGLYVRCGYWRGGGVVSDYDWLDGDWSHRGPAADVAS